MDQAEGNVSDDDLPNLEEIHAKIVVFLSSIPDLESWIRKLDDTDAARAYYLRARLSVDQSYDLKSAFDLVKTALDRFPDHLGCLRLAARLHHELHPEDWRSWKEYLDRIYQQTGGEGQLGLLFNLGLCACQSADFQGAWEYFEELESLSRGHPRRSGIGAVVKDEDEEPMRFAGVVERLAKWEGWIRSDALGQQVKFITVRQKFTVTESESVTFSIALNYRGFLAIELRQI